MNKTTFGVIVANRGFFPDHLAQEGHKAAVDVLKKAGYDVVILSDKDSKFGAVETYDEAKKCAKLFADNADKIDGIIVTLPNFGDERGVAESIKRCGLEVPVLIHAEPDVSGKMTVKDRRDSFCGKMSVCNNLRQAGIPYTLTGNHTVKIKSAEFKGELDNFASVCMVIRGLKNARFGAIGARPAAFNTVRYSEKLLEYFGIGVETVDLSEIFGQADRLKDSDNEVKSKLAAIKKYVKTEGVPEESLSRIARFGAVVDRWAAENELKGTAIQCWTSMEEFFGITPCTLMSMMSESLMPSACEVDVMGLVGMYILQQASGSPSALLDWNNNFGQQKDKCMLFHCSNLPKSFFRSSKMDYQEIIAGAVGQENTYGTIVGKIKPAATTFLRLTTDDTEGVIGAYTGEGKFTEDKVESFGGYGVMEIKNLQVLLQYICRMGFEHHVAMNMCEKADAIAEALGTYLGWDVYRHV